MIKQQSKQVGEFINYANEYYKHNGVYGSLDAISLEFPEEFTDQEPLVFLNDDNTTISDYRVNKVPTGAIIIYDYNFYARVRILLKRGKMVGMSCKADNLLDDVNMCVVVKKNIRKASHNSSGKRVSCKENNLTAEECMRVNNAL